MPSEPQDIYSCTVLQFNLLHLNTHRDDHISALVTYL